MDEVKLCEYGCGQESKHQFKNGKWCCEKYYTKCPIIREKNSISNKGQPKSFKGKKKIPLSKETKNKISKSLQGHFPTNMLTIEKIQEKYPIFTKEEEMRYNPDKPKEIQVHCKNHNCPNSKEKGGWFTPTYEQIRGRRDTLEHKDGWDGLYIYCSKQCKLSCPLYHLHSDPYKNIDNPYTDEEYQVFRREVLKRDNYKCLYCGKPAEHVHHTRPQKLEPFFTLDPDYAISVCSDCHYKYGHKEECSTGQLAVKVC